MIGLEFSRSFYLLQRRLTGYSKIYLQSIIKYVNSEEDTEIWTDDKL